MPVPNELTAAQAAHAIANRRITAIELAEACLDRIASLDDRLKAWVYVDRATVLADARAADQAVEQRRPLGPLHGVPIGMKDIYYTAGIPTRAGSEVYKDFVPEYDAATLTLLKHAGALMLGKAVTTEFACLDPSPTVNPWNAAHTPGGSSSGSAVAVASRMCPAALGSQTVGSVLRPAAYNGVVGFKPTFGRVSRYGVVPVSWNLDTVGWLVRSVEDAALLLQVMSGPDVNDPVSSHEPVGDYLSVIVEPPAPRIGMLRRYFYEGADAETRRHIDAVAEQLAQAGAEIEELPMPDSIDTAYVDQRLIMSVEAAAFHEPMYRVQAEDYQPKLRAMLAGRFAGGRHRLFARPGEPTAVYRRHGTAFPPMRRSADPGRAVATAGRRHEHRRSGVPGAMDIMRPAGDCAAVGHRRVGTAPGHPVGGVAVCRSEAAGRGGVVRSGAGVGADAAGVILSNWIGSVVHATRVGNQPSNEVRTCYIWNLSLSTRTSAGEQHGRSIGCSP